MSRPDYDSTSARAPRPGPPTRRPGESARGSATLSLSGLAGTSRSTGAIRRPWRIDVSEVADGPAYRIGVTHGGLATSSVLGRTWESTRGTEHHVIDPTTGRPARGSLRTATVWAGTALAANTWSTAALVWGDSAAARLHEQGVAARLVDHAGAMTAVGAWPPVKATAA